MKTGIIENFGGGGGWKVGLAMLGRRDAVAVEWDDAAVSTSRAAGFATVQADVAKLDPGAFAVEHDWTGEGYIASPPCQGFSAAGKGKGRADVPLILAAVERAAAGDRLRDVLDDLRRRCSDPRTPLVMEPLRWALELRPAWIALEQAPPVLPLWEAFAQVLRGVGYRVATGNVGSETLGVPQTRKRAVLVASLTGAVALPAPTHSRYHSRDPQRLDPGVAKWVSMAQALAMAGLPLPGEAMRSNYGTNGNSADRGERLASEPAPTVTSRINRNMWVRGAGAAPVRVSVAEAAVLQSFPVDHPFVGNKGQRCQQVGDAKPPLMAAHVLRAAGAGTFRADIEEAS